MLWSRDRTDRPTGIFSHQTALSLHELTDANPARIDLTVPPDFRRSAPIPKVLRLHYGNVPPDEQVEMFGVPATSAVRSILDVSAEGSIPQADLRTAFQEGLRRGSITWSELEKYAANGDYAKILQEFRQ